MASIFRQRYTKRNPVTGERTIHQTKNFYIQYRDERGCVVRVPGLVDRMATEQLARDLETERDRILAGVLPAEVAAPAGSLVDQLAAYERRLLEGGDTPGHVASTLAQIRAVFSGCGCATAAALTADLVRAWLAELRADGRPAEVPRGADFSRTDAALILGCPLRSVATMARRHGLPTVGPRGRSRRFPRSTVVALAGIRARGRSVATSNHYLTAVKGFCNFLVPRILAANPLDDLDALNAEADPRHERRALEPEEFARLIEQTRAGAVRRQLSGADRAALYLVAAYTGLRASELASLRPSAFHLATTPATVTIRATHAKDRSTDAIALQDDLVPILAAFLKNRPAGRPVWDGTRDWHRRAADTLRTDLAAAGIPFRDA